MGSIVVTGIGMASSLGPSQTACAAARAGLVRPAAAAYQIEVPDDEISTQVTVYRCGGLSEASAAARLPILLARALEDLVQTAGLAAQAAPVPLLVNAPPLEDAAGRLAPALRGSPSKLELVIEHGGHAGAIKLLADASARLVEGKATQCIVAGLDSFDDPATFEQLDATRQLKTPLNGDGFIPGEGAALLLVERRQDAEARGATILAEVGPLAIRAADYSLLADDFVPTGAAWASAIRSVIDSNPGGDGDIGDIVHDYNGWSRRGREWAMAFMRAGRLFEKLNEASNSTTAECFGDVGAANAAIALCTSATALSRGYASKREILVAAASDGGQRAAAILRRIS